MALFLLCMPIIAAPREAGAVLGEEWSCYDIIPRSSILCITQVLSLLGFLYTIWRRLRTNGDDLGLLVSISYCEDFLSTLNTRWSSMVFRLFGTITTAATGCWRMGSRCDRRWGDGWNKSDSEIEYYRAHCYWCTTLCVIPWNSDRCSSQFNAWP